MNPSPTRHGRSDRVGHLKQSEIRRMTRECTRVGGVNLGQGICDLPTPQEVLQAASQAVLSDLSTYSKYEGVDPLRAALADKALAYNKLSVDPDHEILVTIGATGALTCIVQALMNPGDEVILFEPYYGYHLNTLKVGGVHARFVTLTAPDWTVTREAVEAQITPNTRALLFSNPTNPSGKVWSRQELEIIADVCKDHDLLAITDEIYEYIIYGDAQHISLASLPGMFERTLTISGFSKTFSITGWRLGTVMGPAALVEPVGLINDLFYVCAPTPLQHGVAQGMRALTDGYYAEMARDYEAKRDAFCATLASVGLTPHVPAGAYYVLADVSNLNMATSREAAMHILETVGVASVPGSAFHISSAGESLTRFCYAKDWDTLGEAMRRLKGL